VTPPRREWLLMKTDSGSRHSPGHRASAPTSSPAGPGAQYFAFGLFVLLAGFTVTVTDKSEISAHWIGAGLLLLVATWMVVGFHRYFYWSVPTVSLSLMAGYGVCQTVWSPYKILSEGWRITTFWWTCAAICLVSHQLFRDLRLARQFRFAFAYFASVVCVLDLLQQASHTDKVLWIFPTDYPVVFGPFQYYNNFAQFVELSLPLTLWLGLGQRRPSILMLLLAAVQISAVMASPSRAGVILVIAEFLTVLFVSWLHGRLSISWPVVGIAIALTVGWVAVAGFDSVTEKLKGRDQLSVRRQINQASIDMVKTHPWIGWGLGTYVPVYPEFARYDDGTYVNHAHNDWLEWAAEGGVFFAGLMLLVFLWTLRSAWRSVWGLGVVFVCIHALVDYPFARLAVCGWYFALVGMLAGHRVEERVRYHPRTKTDDDEDEMESLPTEEQVG
jgi:O-antigen ligase